MIKIVFEEPTTEEWKTWKAKCKHKTEELIKIVKEGKPFFITDLYKDKKVIGVFFNREGAFHGKCVYCEVKLKSYQHGDLDHYRPKNRVTDEKDQIVYIVDEKGQSIRHPGYYWLAYEWSNLLPSCEICNRPSSDDRKKIGKRNRFPVKGKHAAKPGEQEQEIPLLIHPVLDNPAEHLFLDVETGILGGKTERGKMCIEIFGLNIREDLVTDRREMIEAVEGICQKIISKDIKEERLEELAQEVKDIKSGKKKFSMAGRAMLKFIRQRLLL